MPKRTPPGPPTPEPVLDAIWVIADYLHRCGYDCVVIGPKGGAVFRRQNILDDLNAAYTELQRLADRAEAEAKERKHGKH